MMKLSKVCPACQIFCDIPISTDLPSQGCPRQLFIALIQVEVTTITSGVFEVIFCLKEMRFREAMHVNAKLKAISRNYVMSAEAVCSDTVRIYFLLSWTVFAFLKPSGDLGMGLVWDNLSTPTPLDHFSIRPLKSSSNWTKLSIMGPQLFSGWYIRWF